MRGDRCDIDDLVGHRPMTRAAISYAERAHQGQRRAADGAPFIEHPLEVAVLLVHSGAPDRVIAAGVLHDVIEKGGADPSELEQRFGRGVATLVQAVSEDPSIGSYARRKAALRRQAARAGDEALAIFAADKISKVRELRLESRQSAADAHQAKRLRERRFAHYRASLRMLEQHLSRSPLVAQLALEFQQLSARVSGGAPAVSSAASRSHAAI